MKEYLFGGWNRRVAMVMENPHRLDIILDLELE
jgi:hypothetical protein